MGYLRLAVGLTLIIGAAASNRAASAPPRPAAIVDLPDTPAQLVLDEKWLAEPDGADDADGSGLMRVVALYRDRGSATGLNLVVMRFDAPNAAAWRPTTRAAYLDDIEAGIAAACPSAASAGTSCRGYRRIKRVLFHSQGVPAMDLHAVNQAGATLLFRLLLFRTYTILAAVEVPPRSASAATTRARRALATFTPSPNWQR
jgi:hypothetical protein